jgi:hypothetical protein
MNLDVKNVVSREREQSKAAGSLRLLASFSEKRFRAVRDLGSAALGWRI